MLTLSPHRSGVQHPGRANDPVLDKGWVWFIQLPVNLKASVSGIPFEVGAMSCQEGRVIGRGRNRSTWVRGFWEPGT